MPQPSWELLGLFSAGSAALGAIATASIINALSRRRNSSGSGKSRDSPEPSAKRQKLSPPSPAKPEDQPSTSAQAAAAGGAGAGEVQQQHLQDEGLNRELSFQQQQQQQATGDDVAAAAAAQQDQQQQQQQQQQDEDAPGTPDAEASGAGHLPQPDSVVDLQKLQELEQRVADLNALAELGKVYQDSLALSAQLRNLSSFRLQQDKVLGRGSLAVVQEGEYAGDSVAVKLLPIGSVFAEDSRKEACLALCLHHPNIVRVVGVHLVEVEARPFLALVQEAAPGGDLGWQIEDCDFHMGPRGEASLDVSLKLLLDAARGLAYMHDVDVVHGDVKSRNLLVFWETDEEEDEVDVENAAAAGAGVEGGEQQQQSAGGTAGSNAAGGDGGVEQQQEQQGEPARSGSPGRQQRQPVWGLKWCDFGVSFRAAEAPGGILRTVTGTPGFRAPEVMDIGWGKAADTYAFGIIAWQLLTGEKPIVYDREWRMHMPNPNLLRVPASASSSQGAGQDAIPRPLIDLVLDCGAYSADQRPSMREVVQRLEDIAMTRLEAERAAEAAEQAAAAQAAAAAAAAEAQAQAAAEEARVQEAAQAATDAAAAAAQESANAAAAAAAAHPVCHKLRTGGLARALSQQARDAAAGGAAADMAAAQQQLQHLIHHQQQQQHGADGLSAAATGVGSPAAAAAVGAGQHPQHPQHHHHHRFEVLIENDDDPITAEAVAHTLEQFEANSLAQVLSGHPYAVHQASRAHASAAAAANGGSSSGGGGTGTAQGTNGGAPGNGVAAAAVRSLHHSATAPVHSHLLDTAAEAAEAATTAEGAAAAVGGGRSKSIAIAALGGAGGAQMPAPINITGAVSRANIELLPATGPGLVSHGTPPLSPTAAAGGGGAGGVGGAAAAAAGGAGDRAGSVDAPAGAAAGAGGSSWFLASGSSFKKGMWLEKTHMGIGGGAAGADGQPSSSNLRLQATAAGSSSPGQQHYQQQHQMVGSPAAAAAGGGAPSSPLSLGAAVAVPDSSCGGAGGANTPNSRSSGSFSLQLRRESQSQHLPTVAEDELHGAWQLGAAAAGGLGGGAAGGGGGGGGDNPAAAAATGAAVDAAAARALRRSSTTRRLSTDVLAAAGALSKALSAFSSASQALPAVVAAGGPGSAGSDSLQGALGGVGAAGVVGSNILLTQDFVAAARGLSEALAALLPSATALADADPGQGAAAAAAATEAVQGLRSLQGKIASAKAAAAASGGYAGGSGGVAAAMAAAGAASPSSYGSPAAGAETAAAASGSLMGPPRPVNMPAAAAAGGTGPSAGRSQHTDSAFANMQQQQFAFSPPQTGPQAPPMRSAALPVPITGGPRRSFDGGIGRHQLSWTHSRARAVSYSGAPGGDASFSTPGGAAAAAGGAMGGAAVGGGAGQVLPSSYDSLNMSLPQRFSLDEGSSRSAALLSGGASLHGAGTPPCQQLQLQSPPLPGLVQGQNDAGVVGSAGSGGSPWGAEPVLLRQPSRRRSIDGAGLNHHRPQQ